MEETTLSNLSTILGLGGSGIGGGLVTLAILKLLGIPLGKNNQSSPSSPCPLIPPMASIEKKMDRMIEEQIRSNTYLEIMTQHRHAGGEK